MTALVPGCSTDDETSGTGGTAGQAGGGGHTGGAAGVGAHAGGGSAGSGGGLTGGNAGGGGIAGSGGQATGGGAGTGGQASGKCAGLNPAGCNGASCPTGTKCDLAPCAPSSCQCIVSAWTCSQDCHAGVCVGTKDCSTIATGLAQKLPATGACTGIVRLRFKTLQVISYAFECGPSAPPNEAAARATAEADTGFGTGTLLSGPNPPDAWVFNELKSDTGGAAAVSARTGLTVFGGSIIWLGLGKVTYPATWETNDIGSTCSGPSLPGVRGIDLASTPGGLPPAETLMAAAAVARTAVPAALAQSRTLRETLVLRYAPKIGITQAGNFEHDTAEYVVLLNAD